MISGDGIGDNPFDGVVEDTPMFREYIRRTHDSVSEVSSKMKKYLKAVKEMKQAAHDFSMTSNQFLHDTALMIADIRRQEDPLFQTMYNITQSLNEIEAYRERMTDVIEKLMAGPLERFLREDVSAVGDSYRAYSRTREAVDTATLKHSQLRKDSRARVQDAAEIELREAKLQHRQSSLDFACTLKHSKDRLRMEFVEVIYQMFGSQQNFYHQSYDLFQGFAVRMKEIHAGVLEERKKFEESEQKDAEQRKKIESSPLVVSVPTTKGELGHEISGYLFKRSSNLRKDWQRRYFQITDGKLLYFKTEEDQQKPGIVLDLILTSARERPDAERRFCFEIISPQASFLLQAENYESMLQWLQVLEAAKTALLNGQDVPSVIQSPKKDDENSPLHVLWKMSPENRICADCGAENPEWASINLGVIICIQCSGVHRAMGVHISKARSLLLDHVEPEAILLLARLGNKVVNTIFEGKLPVDKPHITKDTREPERNQWIRDKYEKRIFLSPDSRSRDAHTLQFREAATNDDIPAMMYHFAYGADIDIAPPPEKLSVLHVAVRQKLPLVVAFLVNNNAMLDQKDAQSWTPLHHAADQEVADIAAIILRGGGCHDKKTADGKTPLDVAMQRQHANCATILKIVALAKQESIVDAESSFLTVLRDFEQQIKGAVHGTDIASEIQREFSLGQSIMAKRPRAAVGVIAIPRSTASPMSSPRSLLRSSNALEARLQPEEKPGFAAVSSAALSSPPGSAPPSPSVPHAHKTGRPTKQLPIPPQSVPQSPASR